jgi:hypothetical protein
MDPGELLALGMTFPSAAAPLGVNLREHNVGAHELSHPADSRSPQESGLPSIRNDSHGDLGFYFNRPSILTVRLESPT